MAAGDAGHARSVSHRVGPRLPRSGTGNRKTRAAELESCDVTGAARRRRGGGSAADRRDAQILILLLLLLLLAGLDVPGALEELRDRACRIDRGHHRPARGAFA